MSVGRIVICVYCGQSFDRANDGVLVECSEYAARCRYGTIHYWVAGGAFIGCMYCGEQRWHE